MTAKITNLEELKALLYADLSALRERHEKYDRKDEYDPNNSMYGCKFGPQSSIVKEFYDKAAPVIDRILEIEFGTEVVASYSKAKQLKLK